MQFALPAALMRGIAQLRSSTMLPYIVLLMSLATTAVWWYVLVLQSRENAYTEFKSEARQAAEEIRGELLGFEEVLQAGAGLMLASDTVSHEEWRRFIDRLELPRAYPGIETIVYAERVRTEQIPALEARMREQGATGFRVWPPGSRTEHVVNILAEPYPGTGQEILGFDLSSEATRRLTLERARDTGAIKLSSRVKLLTDPEPQTRPAVLMFAPVYRGGLTPTTVTARREALIGYVGAAFHVDEVLSAALAEHPLPFGVAVWEGNEASPDALMYMDPRGERLLGSARERAVTTDISITLSDQRWIVRFAVPRDALQALQGTNPLVALAVGVCLSMLLFGIAWSESTLRTRATELANEMTEAVRKQANLLDITHDTILLRDRSNVIRYWNRAASDTYGYSAEEAIGRSADDLLKTRFPIALDAVWAELKQNDRWEGELVHTRRDGTEIIVASRWVVERDAHGQIESILETNNDITERRRAEDDRRRLEASLLQSQKLEAMGTLAGGVAHDFNNILASILGYGELAQGIAPGDTAMRRYVDNIMTAGLRAKSLVERILAFSRSGVGPRVAVHVQSVVAESLELLSASLPDNIRLERSLDADDAAVSGDPTQIHQVVFNLCTNALQAMKSGGTLRVTLDVITLSAPRTALTNPLSPGDYVRLSVKDTGSGIAAELRDRIFDPFFTTKGVGVGTGLGLSLVHGIVVDLGGGIDMASELGKGTTFSVYLPRHGRFEPVAAEDEAIARGNGETILLVDDEEVLVQLGEELIAKLGYEPVGCTSATQALELFREDPQRFAAVLSDETMPEMAGSQLAARLIAIRPDIPIILMSGYAGATLAARARSAGARDVLGKPLQSRDIARAIAGVLQK